MLRLQTEVADELAQDLPPTLAKELSVVYFPQLGYLIAIAYEPEVTDAGKYAEIGWDFQVRCLVRERQLLFPRLRRRRRTSSKL